MSAGDIVPWATCSGGHSARGDKLSPDTGSEARNWLGLGTRLVMQLHVAGSYFSTSRSGWG